jgi:hypothetical protein
MRSTRIVSAASAALSGALFATALLAPAAQAGTRMTIEFTDVRTFEGDSSVTTSLDECPTATTEDHRTHTVFGPRHGVFVGIRDFQCGDGSGFVVRVTARFNDEGSTGSWSIVSAYGSLAGLRGAGSLVGTSTDAPGIIDHYTGWVTWH